MSTSSSGICFVARARASITDDSFGIPSRSKQTLEGQEQIDESALLAWQTFGQRSMNKKKKKAFLELWFVFISCLWRSHSRPWQVAWWVHTKWQGSHTCCLDAYWNIRRSVTTKKIVWLGNRDSHHGNGVYVYVDSDAISFHATSHLGEYMVQKYAWRCGNRDTIVVLHASKRTVYWRRENTLLIIIYGD